MGRHIKRYRLRRGQNELEAESLDNSSENIEEGEERGSEEQRGKCHGDWFTSSVGVLDLRNSVSINAVIFIEEVHCVAGVEVWSDIY